MNKTEPTLDKNEMSWLSRKSYDDLEVGRTVPIHGLDYKVLATTSSSSGFQAVALERADKIHIAYRGTEAVKLRIWDQPVKDVGADYQMVRNQATTQTPDAEAFTERVLAGVQARHPSWKLSEHVFTTGHSLGGTHAETMAWRHQLGGAAFNAYGAVDLGYGVTRGQPEDAPAFTGYMRATDAVSSASRHYGAAHIYATENDIKNLVAGRYLSTPDPNHPANPTLAISASAHFVDNFAPDPGKGESIMTAANEARYIRYKAAIDHYCHDVMTSRIDLHDALEYGRRSPQGQRLEAKIDDALDVIRYSLATGLANHALVEPIEHHLDQTSRALHVYGDAINLTADHMEHSTRAAGQTVTVRAEQLAHGAHAAGQISQQSADMVSRGALSMGRWSPGLTAVVVSQSQRIGHDLHASAQAISKGAHWVGQLVHGGADTTARAIHVSGDAAHGMTDSASLKTYQLGQTIHNISQRLRSTQGHDAVVDKVHQVEHAAHEMRGRVGNTLEHAYDTLTHSGSWFESGKEPASPSATPHGKPSFLRPFGDPSHPEHALYSDLKSRLPDLSDERLAQVTGECHKRDFKAGFEGYAVTTNEQIAVRDTDRVTMSHVQVFTNQPAPSVQQTMQHVQACEQQHVQDMAQFQALQAQINQQQGPVMGGPGPGGPGF